MNKKKFGKLMLKVGTGFLVFAGALVGTYSLIPNEKRIVDLTPQDIGGGGSNIIPEHFQSFVDKVTKGVGLGDEAPAVYEGLHATFDDFELRFTTENSSLVNIIKIEGALDFLMRGWNDVNFNLNLDVDYNTREVPLEIGFVNSTLYFGLKDFRVKFSTSTLDEVLEEVSRCFAASIEEGGINFNLIKFLSDKINGFVDGLITGIDFNSLLAGSGDSANSTSFAINEAQKPSGDWDFTISVTMTEDNVVTNEINVVITTDEDLNFKRVDLGTITFGNFTISGAIDMEVIPDHIVYTPEDVLSPAYNANYEYVELVSYKGWIKKIANLIAEDNQKFALDFSLDLKHEEDNGAKAIDIKDIAKIEGNLNVDFSSFLDISGYEVTEEEPELDEHGGYIIPNTTNGNVNTDPEDDRTLVERIKEDVSLGVTLDLIGQNDEHYGNVALNYVDGEAYLNLNESGEGDNKSSVLKAKLDTETFNWIMNEMPSMINSLSEEDTNSAAAAAASADDNGLFSFITNSEVVSAIKSGDYSAILDLISNISNDDEKMYLNLDLSGVGLGSDASVNLVLDSSKEDEHKVLSLTAENIEFGDYKLDAAIESGDFEEIVMSEEDKESYDSMSFLPSVFDQVSGILQEKRLGFEISGSVLDNSDLGIVFDGKGQLDYGQKFGFGDLTLEQYKYNSNTPWYTHKIALDVDNQGEDFKQNNVYMIYGDPNTSKNIKAKLTVQSILDIVDTVKVFLNESGEDSRFTKFLEPLTASLGAGAISDAIANKDYLRLAKNDLLKEVSQRNNGMAIHIVVGGEMIGLGSDLTLDIQFKNNSENKRIIDSIVINDLVIGEAPEQGEEDTRKNVNLSLSLKEFDENRTSPCDHSWDYMDLNSVATLLDLGINTTKLGYYQLQATIGVNAISIINFEITLTVHVVVDGKNVKLYSKIPDLKAIKVLGTNIAQEHISALMTRSAYSEFTFRTYPDNDPNKTNDIGGYFDIKRTHVDKNVLFWKPDTTTIYHYRSTSRNFVDNILTYLVVDLLDIKQSYVDLIGDIALSNSDEQKPATDFTNLFTSTGFQYNTSAKKWNIGLNLNEVTGIDALKELEVEITGQTVGDKSYLNRLVADLRIRASLAEVNIHADVKLVNIDPSATNWSNEIQAAFDKIVNHYFNPAVLDNPNSAYSYKD